jgi:hypothetical protein
VQDPTPELEDMITGAKLNLSDAESWDLEELLTKYEDICYEVRWLQTDRQCTTVKM